MESLLPKVMCQGLLDLKFHMLHAQPAVWITRGVQHSKLQDDLLPLSPHEIVQVTTAAKVTTFGHGTRSKAAMEVSASQKNVPSRAFSTLGHTKESQVDDYLVGISHGCSKQRHSVGG